MFTASKQTNIPIAIACSSLNSPNAILNKSIMYRLQNLNGLWQLHPGKSRPSNYTHKVNVPALVDAAHPEINWQDFDYIWYRTHFDHDDEMPSQHIFLQMEQVQFGTRVFLNDQAVGDDIACYTMQEFELTPYVEPDKHNKLEVRVGQKHTLPDHSAVGNDFEKLSFIPGIWGDVLVQTTGPARVQWLRIIPDLQWGGVHLRFDIQSWNTERPNAQLIVRLREKKSKRLLSENYFELTLNRRFQKWPLELPVNDFELWSPENPFLYCIESELWVGDTLSHRLEKHFGMRTFKIRGRHFYLNHEKVKLRGSNIAFHRLLSDEARNHLPWQEKWIKRILVDIPKAHHLSFFRMHLGHAYNRWYDIADENGVMLQDEWMFWTPTGSKKQIMKEFRSWIKENMHHPSIVIWDPLNESEDANITNEIVPELKELDPTRPWEHVDFHEDHPYIYSLGPVIPIGSFGFSRAIEAMRHTTEPIMVNEFVWWWLDESGKPADLMTDVVLRWLGRNPSIQQLLDYQAFLAAELCEFFRRLDVDAIMPFVYLSCSQGPTSHWFYGNLRETQPKPILKRLKNVMSPVSVSIDLLDRHFFNSDRLNIILHCFNDMNATFMGRIEITFRTHSQSIKLKTMSISMPAQCRQECDLQIEWPAGQTGFAWLKAAIMDENDHYWGDSQKPLWLFERDDIFPGKKPERPLTVCSEDPQVFHTLRQFDWPFDTNIESCTSAHTMLIDRQAIHRLSNRQKIHLQNCTAEGGLLIVQQPEINTTDRDVVSLFSGFSLIMQYRKDPEKGGYDSAVIAEDAYHSLFNGVDPEHLRIWNGHTGGQMVSQHHIYLTRPFHTIASCNLGLRVPAIMEAPYGKGRIIISRLITSGRLLPEKSAVKHRMGKEDPVAIRYWSNLLRLNPSNPVLTAPDSLISWVYSSDGQVFDIQGDRLFARWHVIGNEPVTITIRLYNQTTIKGLYLRDIRFQIRQLQIRIKKRDENGETPLSFQSRQFSDSCVEITWPALAVIELKLIYSADHAEKDHTLWNIQIQRD